jgi:hypothetical protein
MFPPNTPNQYVEIFDYFLARAEFGDRRQHGRYQETAHAHGYGRAGAFFAFEEVVKKCAGRDDIWLATWRHLRPTSVPAFSECQATIATYSRNAVPASPALQGTSRPFVG